jgi:membrane associated rhomboid family serine protease
MTPFRPSRFEILPTIIKNLLIINGLVYLVQFTVGEDFGLNNLFALHTWQSVYFKPWQFFTHMFMHGDFYHLLGNMFALWMFGSVLENVCFKTLSNFLFSMWFWCCIVPHVGIVL